MSSEPEQNDRPTMTDAVLSAIPLPSNPSSSASCPVSRDLADTADHFGGSGGAFSGAGASDGWSNCDVSNAVSDVAESTGSALVDVISSFSPF
jgi:hypothetical protein